MPLYRGGDKCQVLVHGPVPPYTSWEHTPILKLIHKYQIIHVTEHYKLEHEQEKELTKQQLGKKPAEFQRKRGQSELLTTRLCSPTTEH